MSMCKAQHFSNLMENWHMTILDCHSRPTLEGNPPKQQYVCLAVFHERVTMTLY